MCDLLSVSKREIIENIEYDNFFQTIWKSGKV